MKMTAMADKAYVEAGRKYFDMSESLRALADDSGEITTIGLFFWLFVVAGILAALAVAFNGFFPGIAAQVQTAISGLFA